MNEQLQSYVIAWDMCQLGKGHKLEEAYKPQLRVAHLCSKLYKVLF